jgi:hypothetical protein
MICGLGIHPFTQFLRPLAHLLAQPFPNLPPRASSNQRMMRGSLPVFERMHNPTGIQSSSPGLRGTSYPGSASNTLPNLKGLYRRPRQFDLTLSGLISILFDHPA